MSNKEEDNRYEQASIEAWGLAVYHAELAQDTLENISQLYWLAQKVIQENQMMAGFYLALGGYGDDKAAYKELGLTYESDKMLAEQELNILAEDYYIEDDEDDEDEEY